MFGFTFSQILFGVFGLATVACSIAVVVTQNIVRAAVWLLFALSATAALFFLLGADLVGAAQLLIYVGGTLVLVVFGVMLTARGPFVRMQTRPGEWTLAAVIGMILLMLVLVTVGSTPWPERGVRATDQPVSAANSPTATQVGMEFLNIPPPDRTVDRDPANVGYLLPFEIVSVHLLVVLIGAAYLARAKRRKVKTS